ncbi:hypothetical protein, partial [Escherichia coli]|uniref:hypothetical protein n=1 Tax=Escherichia coli TaxID=562 RepID=UPI001BC8B1EE
DDSSSYKLTSSFLFTAVISRPEGEYFKEIVRVLQEVPNEVRDIDSVLTNRNLRIVGLIERNPSIRLEGTLRAVSKKRMKRKAPDVVIAEGVDPERTLTDNELKVGPSCSFQDSGGRRKDEAVAHKRSKS